MADGMVLSLQESVLTALLFDDKKGHQIAAVVTAEMFDEPYRELAEKALAYRNHWHRAPGDAHIDDIFERFLNDPKEARAKLYRDILGAMVSNAKYLNAEYILDETMKFVRQQSLKHGVLRIMDRWDQGGDGLNEDVEAILFDMLRKRAEGFKVGSILAKPEDALAFMTAEPELFQMGIPPLDKFGVCPARKEMICLIGPKGFGKSWWEIRIGEQGLLNRHRVLHVTLEMTEERVMQRYLMAIFGVARRREEYDQTVIKSRGEKSPGSKFEVKVEDFAGFGNVRRNTWWDDQRKTELLNFETKNIKQILRKRITDWGARFEDLVVKDFPSGSLTIQAFRAYLDALITTHRFHPDIILVDYPDLFAIDPRNPRFSLGRVYVDLRGIASEYNAAMVVVTQANRKGATEKRLRGHHVAEDWSKLMTADVALTFSQTPDEHSAGLARIWVDKARFDRDRFEVLITQNYGIGQFALQCTRMVPNYWKTLPDFLGHDLKPDEPEDKEEEDAREVDYQTRDLTEGKGEKRRRRR